MVGLIEGVVYSEDVRRSKALKCNCQVFSIDQKIFWEELPLPKHSNVCIGWIAGTELKYLVQRRNSIGTRHLRPIQINTMGDYEGFDFQASLCVM